jgi:hypothetical protein
MSEVSLRGLPAGSVTVGITQGAQTVSQSSTWPNQADPASDNLVFVSRDTAGAQYSGVASGVSADFIGEKWGAPCTPKHFQINRVATQNHANRVYGDFNFFNTERHPIVGGGRAQIYRIQNGVRNLIRTSTIVGGAWDTWALATPGNQVITAGNSWEYKFDSFNRPGVTYWFSVASVDASGNIGPRSASVAYTAPGTLPTGVPSNAATTALTLTAVAGVTAAPTGLAAVTKSGDNGVAQLTWTSAEARHVVYVSYNDPAQHFDPALGRYVELASDGGAAIKIGDEVVILAAITQPSADMVSNRAFNITGSEGYVSGSPIRGEFKLNTIAGVNYEFKKFDGGDPKPDDTVGAYYLRVTIDEGAVLPKDGRFWNAGTGQEFRDVHWPDTTYYIKFKRRANKSGSMTLPIGATGVSNQTVSLTTSWQEYYFEFTPSAEKTGTAVGEYLFTITGPTGGIIIDRTAIEVGIVGQPYMCLRPTIAPLCVPGSYHRAHQFVKAQLNSFSMETLTDPVGTGSARTAGPSLAAFFRNCVTAGQAAWLQIDWHVTEELPDLVAYMCAPVSSGHPMALKRAAQGQSTPWIDVLPDPLDPNMPRVLFEISNEMWNSIRSFATTNAGMIDEVTAEVYTAGHAGGLVAARFIAKLQESPYWSLFAPHVEFCIGCFGVESQVQWGRDAMRFAAPQVKFWAIAAYTGGWETGGFSPSELGTDYLTVLNYDQGVNKARRDSHIASLQAHCTANSLTYGVDMIPMIYEGGPSYDLPGAGVSTAIVQTEVVMKSRAAGAANLLASLAHAEAGLRLSHYFQMEEGFNWGTKATRQAGGGVYMSWLPQQVLNEEMVPCSVREVLVPRKQTQSINGPSNTPITVDTARAFMLRSLTTPSTWMLVAINTCIDPSLLEVSDPLYSATPGGTQTLTIGTNWQSAAAMTFWESRGSFREHNRFPVGFRLDPSLATYTIADPNCVAITFTEQAGTVPSNIQRIPITLEAGEFVMMKFTGVVAP